MSELSDQMQVGEIWAKCDALRRQCDFLRAKADSLSHERALLRRALVGLATVDGRELLEATELQLRQLPAPEADKAAAINAIHALLATLDEPENAGSDAVSK